MAVPIDFTGQRLPKSVLCLLSCRNKKVRRTPGMLQLSIRTKDCLYRYPMFLPGNGGMLPLSFSHGRRPLLFPDVFCPVTKHVLIPMFLTQERYRAGLGSRKKLRIRIGFRRIRNICTARAANSRPYIHNRHLPEKYKFEKFTIWS